MRIETNTYGWSRGPGGLLLVLDPKQFFTELSCKPSSALRHLLFVSLAAAVLHYSAGNGWSNWFGTFVFLLNAIGMTCIYSGVVFIFAKSIFGQPCFFGKVFTICVYASLGPLLLSWIPGAVWVSEPWKWWTSVIGLSTCMPAGPGKACIVVGLALGSIYILFRMLLLTV